MQFRLFAAACICALPLACAAQNELPHPGPKPTSVRGQGCVEAGVENNCLLARDLHTGRLYNLLIKGLAPPIGIGIEFTGQLHKGPSTCMQGIAVDVRSWTRKDGFRCRHPSPHKK